MIIAYGQSRSDRDFTHVAYDRLYIDAPKKRDEWHTLVARGGLVKGDTLVVVSEHDLGRGKRLNTVKAGLVDAGVELAIEPLPAPPQRPAATSKHWRPTKQEKAYVTGLWRNRLLSREYVKEKAAEWRRERGMPPHPLTDNMLNRACGKRNIDGKEG